MADDASFWNALSPRYRLVRELGRGGMATVYLTEDLKHHRLVALKVLRHEMALLLGHDRFQREIQVVSQLNHPNILPLHDSDDVQGRLFFVMPYVEGGTLRDRLATGPRPTLGEALDLTRQVGAGLAYSHGRTPPIVHRDIKPANLLLSSGHVFISDFGIARMIREAATGDGRTEEGLTETGLAVGTPSYMAPEQLRGVSQVDGRADEYSLAAVLYEMLVGVPPTQVPGGARGASEALRRAHPEAPNYVLKALDRALAADPESRFKGVADFVASLGPPPALVAPVRRRPARALLGVAVLLGLLGLLAVRAGGWPWPEDATEAPDSTRIAVFPFTYRDSALRRLDETARLQDGLTRWQELSVVPQLELREALTGEPGGESGHAAVLEVARRFKAGRLVRGEVSLLRDSIRVDAALYDLSPGGGPLATATIHLGPDLADIEARFSELANRLLLPEAAPALLGSASPTRSLLARRAFLTGAGAIQRWDLPAADTAFAAATGFDPGYAAAALWLALVRAWSGQEPARWRFAAEQAWAGRAMLGAPATAVASAILAQSAGDYAAACAAWRALTRGTPGDFTSWYGSAKCQDDDRAVVRDPAAASGWRFRSSYHAALEQYQRAFALHPAILLAHRADGYRSLRRLFRANGNEMRFGRALPPDTTRFYGMAAWSGDSLVLLAHPQGERAAPTEGSADREATRRQRLQLRQVALAWRASTPTSADAVEAVAVALDLLADPAARDTLRLARRMSRDRGQLLRLAGLEVFLRLKFGLPGDPAALAAAKRLADSLLAANPPGKSGAPLLLAGLAALTGRAALAAGYSREPGAYSARGVPPLLVQDGAALLAFASLGGPRDSLLRLEREVIQRLNRDVPPGDRGAAREEWLGHAAITAFPEARLEALGSLAGGASPTASMLAAWIAGDTLAVRGELARLRRQRAGIDPAEISFDFLYPEAALLAMLGDTTAAIAWLDGTLQALERTGSEQLAVPWQAGPLLRAARLRGRLGRAPDESTARAWTDAVAILWADADPFFRPQPTGPPAPGAAP